MTAHKGSKATSEFDTMLPPHDELERIVHRAEQIFGYEFENKRLLIKALTHPSTVEEERIELSYERLEFLGDAYLGFVVASEVYRRFPDMNEGMLTRLKSAVVSGASLAQIASDLGFADIIIVGKSERGTHHRGLESALENVYESSVAALMIDGGEGVARDWILRTVGPHITESLAEHPTNPKSSLQEILQERGFAPDYEVVETIGPPHDRTFEVVAKCDGEVIGHGTGRSKKKAEAAAAQNAIDMHRRASQGLE